MKTTAICHGSATIINAIATGKGAAFGIELWTKAAIELDDSGKIDGKIKDAPGEDTTLIELCARKVLDHFNADYGAKIETESSIPIARGLKSSSTAANAVVLGIYGALAEKEDIREADDLALINLGIDAAIDAKVTITGAFDDASSAYFGGYVVTDNTERKILKGGDMETLDVLIFVPEEKTYTHSVDVKRMKLLEREVEIAWNEALKGNLYAALTLNGLLYSATTNNDPDIALEALNAGAIAAGLSGTGPAVAALAKERVDEIRDAWQAFDGDVIKTEVNNEKAHIVE